MATTGNKAAKDVLAAFDFIRQIHLSESNMLRLYFLSAYGQERTGGEDASAPVASGCHPATPATAD